SFPARAAAALSAIVWTAACAGPSEQKLRELVTRLGASARPSVLAGHAGPAVTAATTGTARFSRFVFPAFRSDRALDTARVADRYYREPGNEVFDGVVDALRSEL